MRIASGRVPGAVLSAGHRLRRLGWRLRRPRTWGVKVLLAHPEDPERVLAVRHAYVDHERWALPGGRYRPRRESPAAAGRREVAEELALAIDGKLEELTTREVRTEGKHDTLTLLAGRAASAHPSPSWELREVRWIRRDLADLPPGEPVSRWLQLALAAAPSDPGDRRAAGRRSSGPPPPGDA